MRYANIVLGLLMAVFAAVQYNDPDGPLWTVIYLVPAIWALLVGFYGAKVATTPGRILLALSVAAYAALIVHYWPQAPAFWRKDVWWADEEAREGMGVMIAFAVVVFAGIAAFRARTRRS